MKPGGDVAVAGGHGVLGDRRVAPAVGDPLREADVAQRGEGLDPAPEQRLSLRGRCAIGDGVRTVEVRVGNEEIELGGVVRAVHVDAQPPPARRIERRRCDERAFSFGIGLQGEGLG